MHVAVTQFKINTSNRNIRNRLQDGVHNGIVMTQPKIMTEILA